MKSIASFLLTAALLCSLPLLASAQTTGSPSLQDEFELLRTDLDAIRKSTVAEALKLSDPEGAAFWPIYREYQLELAKLKDRKVKIILDFMDARQNMADEKAEELLGKFFDYKEEELKLKKRYTKRFKKILSPAKTLRWLQVENKFDIMVDVQISSNIPLAE